MQSEWRRLITRPSGSVSESDRERASLLWRCLEQWTRQLRDVRTVLCHSNDGIAASFYEYRMQFNSALKKDMPRTQAEVCLSIF